MTDDFKKKLFDYITGNYTVESGVDTPYVREFEEPTSDIYTSLATLSDYEIKGITNDINNNFIVYYGLYSSTKGFILLADYNLQTIQLITQYSGGTDLPALYYLNYDEIGNFFGISISSGTKYFLMLNNFCVSLTNVYKIVFRQSYALNGILQNCILDYSLEIVKKSNEAKYMFICPYTYTTYINSIIVSTLQINVGSDNEWVHTTYSTNMGTILSFYGEWQSDNYFYKIASFGFSARIYSGSNGGTLSTYTPSNTFIDSGIILNLSTSYYILMTADDEENCFYNFYKIENNIETLIYSLPITRTPTTAYSSRMRKLGNDVLYATNHTFKETFIFYRNNYGIIFDNNVVNLVEQFGDGTITDNSLYFTVKKQYNLYYYYAYNSIDNFIKFKFIYNPSNYNGVEYQNIDSMIPNSILLYDENDKIAFARNLYNKTISGGTTTSTVEVPNNYLNDINISKEELISETNSIVNSDTTAITKNIYEQLYINFINTLNVIDNNTATPVLNPTGASRINDSISQTMDYDNSKIAKYKINYSNGTSAINQININLVYTGLSTNYIIMVYVPLEYGITNIQLLSNDGSTVYQTIDCSSLENNKYYTINQKMEVV